MPFCLSNIDFAASRVSMRLYVYGEYGLNITGLTVAVMLAGPSRTA